MKPIVIKDNVRSRVNDLLQNGGSFFLLKLPGKAPKLVTDPDGDLRIDLVGWRKKLADGIRIGSDKSQVARDVPMPESTSELKYMARVGDLIERLKERGTAKTVISRVIAGSAPEADWINVAERLWNEFPDAVGYLFSTPATGAWLGATPERLLGGWYPAHFTTMALAGTLPVDAEWNVKVYREQQMVEDFIRKALEAYATDMRIAGPRDYIYGPIKHLMTTFSGDTREPADMESVIDILSPTPALSGFPREEAFADIDEIEEHSREMYGGYFLIREGRSQQTDWTAYNAFVIIRCLRFDPADGRWALYSGGGITDMSDPGEEWDETNRKASRLLDILSKY